MVRIQGIVLDQGLGEFVLIQDGTGSIRAETRQTMPLGGGESVMAWGILEWNGTQAYLRDASIIPIAWSLTAEQKITPAPDRPEQLPVLRQARQIRDLAPARAAWKYPVALHGVITSVRQDFRAFYVQDETAGIFVSTRNMVFDTNWAIGREASVEGVSGPGGYAPIVEASSVKMGGPSAMPGPRLATLYQLATGLFDSQWIEVRGIVRSASANRFFRYLEISDVNGLITVELPEGQVLTNLLDSLVRIDGVGISRANPNRQLMSASVWTPGTNFMLIEQAGTANAFALPTKPIASLSQFTQWRSIQHRIKVAGIVTFCQPGRPLFIEDDTGGVPVYLSESADLQPGDRVEVAGYLSPGDFGYNLRNAQCRKIGRAPIPAPKRVSTLGLLDLRLHCLWVQVDARLVGSSHRADETVLTLQADNSIFEALRFDGDAGKNGEPSAGSLPPEGSLVRLKGVYSIMGNESRQPRGLRLFMPSTEPVQLLAAPSWWNGRHTIMVVGILTAVVIASALWVVLLRRRVSYQTRILRERLAQEAALEQRYREMFEAANDLIFTFAPDGKLTSLNPAGQRILGYDAEEFKRLNVDQILAPACARLKGQLLDATPADGTAVTCECELVARDGSHVIVETSARLLFKEGKVQSVQAICRDIVERKRAEEALRESEAHYRQLVELSPNTIFIESQGKFVFVNQAGLSLFGIASADQILGKDVLSIVHPDHRDVVRQRMAKLHGRNESVPLLEEKYLRSDGSVINVEVAAAPVLFENRLAAQVIVHDITQRKRAEEELFESRQMLRTVLDTIPQRVFWKDRNSVYLGCNKPLAEDCGFADPAEVVGKTDFETKTCELAEAYQADDRHVMETGQARLNYEELLIRPGGIQAWLKTSKVPLYDKHGAIIGLLGTYEDITERKRADAALAEASALLQTLLQHIPDCIYFKDRESHFIHFSKSFEQLFNVASSEALRGKSDFDFFTGEHATPAYQDEQEIVRTGKPIIGKLEKETHQDGRVTWALTTKMPWCDKDGKIIGTFGISKDVTAIKEAEAELAYERELFRELLDNFPDAIYFKDRESRFVRVSRSKAEKTFDYVRSQFLADGSPGAPKALPEHLSSVEAFAQYLLGKSDADTFGEAFAADSMNEEREIMRTGQPLIGKLEQAAYPGKWFLVTKIPWRDKDGKIIGTFGVSRDITELKQAEARLEAAHQRLIETSRLAGMAEVATDVLHNVGNVLNSVNVSCSITLDRVRTSKVSSLQKVSSMLHENRERLAEFLTRDPRGRQIPEFLSVLSEHLGGEQAAILKEQEQLVKHVDHIKQIVAMQQTYAKVAGVLETINPVQLLEDALHMNAAALTRHEVQVQRDYEDTPQIVTEKHKVLQILVNLIRNAKYAMDDAKRKDKLLTVKVAKEGADQIIIQVIDNGIGIPTENLTRIFSHGFTTRENGHGFGLHSSALAVRDLGGSLRAYSEGPGTGATFTLQLPLAAPARSHDTV